MMKVGIANGPTLPLRDIFKYKSSPNFSSPTKPSLALCALPEIIQPQGITQFSGNLGGRPFELPGGFKHNYTFLIDTP